MDRVSNNECEIKILKFAKEKLHEGIKSSKESDFKANLMECAISISMLINEKMLNISQNVIIESLGSLEEKGLIHRLKGYQQPFLFLITREGIDILKNNKKEKITQEIHNNQYIDNIEIKQTSEIPLRNNKTTESNTNLIYKKKLQELVKELYQKQQSGEFAKL